MSVEKVLDSELELVNGGTVEEVNAIIAVFRKHGFEAEAKKLEKSGIFFFGDGLNRVLDGLGFNCKIELYASDDRNNVSYLDGGQVGHSRLIQTLDDFLYKKSHNIDIDM